MYGSIQNLLAEKGRQVYTVRKSTPVIDAVRAMNQKGVGSLLVMDGDRAVGIFTERDVLRRIVDVDRDPAITRVVEVMTPDPQSVLPETRVSDAMDMMTSGRFRHLPVIQTGQVIGMVSIGDVMRWVTMYQQGHIEHMTDYIIGRVQA
jgi:CBS domain-containing protein